jgi:hypothetical protein
MDIKAWYPRNQLHYPDGRPFKERQQYKTLDQLFTRRNLMALAWLMDAVEKEPLGDLLDFLKLAFTSMVHLCSRMIAVSNPSRTSHHTPFSSTGWTQQSYWSAPTFMEQNVWDKFESAVLGHQGLVRAKEESNQFFPGVRFSQGIENVISGKAQVHVHWGDALNLMKTMADRHGA